MKKFLSCVPLCIVMFFWGLSLGYPTHQLQYVRWTFFDYILPAYYLFTVGSILAAAALVLILKSAWMKWELLWLLLPLICLPAILHSSDPIWAARQCLSWVVRGIIPGAIIFSIVDLKKIKAILLRWIYPIIIAASLLGLVELCCDYNPIWDNPHISISSTSQPENPFYRPYKSITVSPKPWGTQGNRIPYASTIVAFLPLGLWVLKYQKKAYWLNLVGAGILFSILILAQARSSWIALLAAILLMQVAGLYKNSRKTMGGIACGLVLAGVFLAWPKTHNMLWHRMQSFHWNENSIQERLAVLETINVLKQHWLLGVGFGQFSTACKPYYHSTLPWSGTPDNQYLRWLIENGVPSFFLLMAFFVGLVRAGWRRIQQMQDAQEADFYKSILIGWLSIAVTFLFFDGFYWGACCMTFWCFLGLFATCLKSDNVNS